MEDFRRARYLYQLTTAGEAAELALTTFDEALGHRGALQAVALTDIVTQLLGLFGSLFTATVKESLFGGELGWMRCGPGHRGRGEHRRRADCRPLTGRSDRISAYNPSRCCSASTTRFSTDTDESSAASWLCFVSLSRA